MKFFIALFALVFCGVSAFGQSQSKAVDRDSVDFYIEKLISGINSHFTLDESTAFIYEKGIKDRVLKELNSSLGKIGQAEHKCMLYVALANNYFDIGSYKETQALLVKGLEIAGKHGLKNYQCCIYNMIGNIFGETDMYVNAIQNYNRAMYFANKLKDSANLCAVHLNLGTTYYKYGVSKMVFFDSARKHSRIALKLAEDLKAPAEINRAYQCLGLIETDAANFKEAEVFFRKSIEICQGLNDKSLLYYGQYQLARMFIGKGGRSAADSAIKYLNAARHSALENGDTGLESEIIYELARAHSNKAEYKLSSYYALRFAEFNDSLIRFENARTTAELSEKYESVKKESQITELYLSQKEKQAQIDRQLYMIIVSVIILAMVVFAAFSLYRSNKIRKKANLELSEKNILIEAQKHEVERQKELVDEKNKEIIDSIRYAKRIQQSLLPTQKYMERNLTKLKKGSNKV